MTASLNPRLLFLLLGGALLLVIWLSLALGPVALTAGELWAVARRVLGLAVEQPAGPAELIIGQIRLPRVLMGLCAGLLLALCGVAMQGLFRNLRCRPRPARRVQRCLAGCGAGHRGRFRLPGGPAGGPGALPAVAVCLSRWAGRH